MLGKRDRQEPYPHHKRYYFRRREAGNHRQTDGTYKELTGGNQEVTEEEGPQRNQAHFAGKSSPIGENQKSDTQLGNPKRKFVGGKGVHFAVRQPGPEERHWYGKGNNVEWVDAVGLFGVHKDQVYIALGKEGNGAACLFEERPEDGTKDGQNKNGDNLFTFGFGDFDERFTHNKHHHSEHHVEQVTGQMTFVHQQG